MTLGKYLFFMLIVALVCWACFGVVVSQIDPTSAGFFGFLSFYLTLFFAVSASFAVIGLAVRLWLSHQGTERHQVVLALRQGIWFGLLLVGALLLLSFDLLTWWNGVLLIGILGVLEFLFLSFEKPVSNVSEENFN